MGRFFAITRILGIEIQEKNYKDFIKQFPVPDEDGEPTDKRLFEDIRWEDFQSAVKDAAESEGEYENFFYRENPDETYQIYFGLLLCRYGSKPYSQIIDIKITKPSEEEMNIFNCTEESPEYYDWIYFYIPD